MKICEECGAANRDDARHCRSCGTGLGPTGEPSADGDDDGRSVVVDLGSHFEGAGEAHNEADRIGDYDVRIRDWISEGWELFKQDPIIYVAFALILFTFSTLLEALAGDFGMLLSAPFGAVIVAGPIVVAMRRIRGHDVDFSHLLGGFPQFLPLALAGLGVSLAVTVGMILLILPGVYLLVAYFFALEAVVDRRIGAWQAMELSRRVVTRNWFGIAGFMLVLLLLNILGALMLLVGLLVTVPLVYTCSVAAYRDIFGFSDHVPPVDA